MRLCCTVKGMQGSQARWGGEGHLHILPKPLERGIVVISNEFRAHIPSSHM